MDAVVPDNLWGGYRLTRALLAKGGQRIACVRCSAQDWNSRAKFHGYRLALEEAGRSFDPSLVVEGDFRWMDGARCAKQLAALPEPPDAVFLDNDWMSGHFVEGLRELKRSGARNLDRMVLAHFGDAQRDAEIFFAMDRVELPAYEMGQWAVRLLLDRLAGRGPAAPVTLKVTPIFQPGQMRTAKAFLA